MLEYADGCRGGHPFLEFIDGECFTCGRGPEVPAGDRLTGAVPTEARAAKLTGFALLEEAIAQTGLKMRALAWMEDVDIESLDEFAPWAADAVDDERSVDERLAEHTEAEVRHAIRAAYV
jgi:hypothetical protein